MDVSAIETSPFESKVPVTVSVLPASNSSEAFERKKSDAFSESTVAASTQFAVTATSLAFTVTHEPAPTSKDPALMVRPAPVRVVKYWLFNPSVPETYALVAVAFAKVVAPSTLSVVSKSTAPKERKVPTDVVVAFNVATLASARIESPSARNVPSTSSVVPASNVRVPEVKESD